MKHIIHLLHRTCRKLLPQRLETDRPAIGEGILLDLSTSGGFDHDSLWYYEKMRFSSLD